MEHTVDKKFYGALTTTTPLGMKALLDWQLAAAVERVTETTPPQIKTLGSTETMISTEEPAVAYRGMALPRAFR